MKNPYISYDCLSSNILINDHKKYIFQKLKRNNCPQIITTIGLIASCNASGFAVPAIRAGPIVRYAPFYNFPNTARSIHAISPAFPAVAPAFPAPPVAAPVVAPAPLFAPYQPRFVPGPAPVFPRALPFAPFSPIVRAVAAPLPAPVPAFPAPAPVYPAPAPVFPAPAPVFPAPVPAFPPPTPVFPGFAPAAVGPAPPPALFTSAPHLAFARALPHFHHHHEHPLHQVRVAGPPPAFVPGSPAGAWK